MMMMMMTLMKGAVIMIMIGAVLGTPGGDLLSLKNPPPPGKKHDGGKKHTSTSGHLYRDSQMGKVAPSDFLLTQTYDSQAKKDALPVDLLTQTYDSQVRKDALPDDLLTQTYDSQAKKDTLPVDLLTQTYDSQAKKDALPDDLLTQTYDSQFRKDDLTDYLSTRTNDNQDRKDLQHSSTYNTQDAFEQYPYDTDDLRYFYDFAKKTNGTANEMYGDRDSTIQNLIHELPENRNEDETLHSYEETARIPESHTKDETHRSYEDTPRASVFTSRSAKQQTFFQALYGRPDFKVFRKVSDFLTSQLMGSTEHSPIQARQGFLDDSTTIGLSILGLALLAQLIITTSYLSLCSRDSQCTTACTTPTPVCTTDCAPPIFNPTCVTTCPLADPVCTTTCTTRKKRETSDSRSKFSETLRQKQEFSASGSWFNETFSRNLEEFGLPGEMVEVFRSFGSQSGRLLCGMTGRFME